MKRFGLFAVAALVFGLVGATPSYAGSVNLITNGTFNTPSPLTPGGWGLYANGQISGWSTNDQGGQIEIDTAGAIGPGTNPFSTNSLEVNANNHETVSQTITGLVAGQQYTLTWEYGGRPGSGGTESMNVLLNGSTIATDSSGVVSQLTWTGNSYTFVAGKGETSVTLSFEGSAPGPGGSDSYGNEVTDVALYATPEPATWLLLLSGLGLLGFAMWRKPGLPLSTTI